MGICGTVEGFRPRAPRKVIERTRARPKNEPSCGPCVRRNVELKRLIPTLDMDLRSSPFAPHRVAVHGGC